ncbi:hypothetical protein LPJ53_002409 [Coemansia erecta]|uniref:Uncharacterized protein n=1 Tax=Coemansia erecta TaxID=147472 RepID=A0A9W7Y3E3_9FUNG|nr:hypothetical protein LPJ53_002409 [Coemansia erecta]
MALKIPCPRYDAHGIDCPDVPDGESLDWDQIEPIVAAHSGGHSEFSISYDNGKTFAVLQQNLKYMFFGSPTHLTNTPPNYGSDYPEIPEFRGDYSTGIELYTNSHNITVTGHGNKKQGEDDSDNGSTTTTSDSGDGSSDDTDADYKSNNGIGDGESNDY